MIHSQQRSNTHNLLASYKYLTDRGWLPSARIQLPSFDQISSAPQTGGRQYVGHRRRAFRESVRRFDREASFGIGSQRCEQDDRLNDKNAAKRFDLDENCVRV